MIKFFRNIRQKLAYENNISKYSRYAIGEIVLIMIGIFLALQLNNWNETRKKEEQFKSSLEQLYNKITDDAWYFNFLIRENEAIIKTADNMLNITEGYIVNFDLPSDLWLLTLRDKSDAAPSSKPFLDKLIFNPEDKQQKELANKLINFNELLFIKTRTNDISKEIRSSLIKNGIAFPKFDKDKINKGWVSDSIWYSNEDLKNAKNLLFNVPFRSLLKTQRSYRNLDVLDYKALEQESETILKLIKKYHPDVRLLFEDVGIIGTSINGYDDVGAKSTPMNLTDGEQSIWEISLYLKEGTVKFRCRDSWAINWGGNTFPKGDTEREGFDIKIPEAGHYKIILNLTENTYEFIKQQ